MRRLQLGALLFSLTVSSSAPASAPTKTPSAALPFVGEGKDFWGAQIQTADKLAIRKMLLARQFSELTAAVEGLQAISDQDCARELVGLDAFDSFQSGDARFQVLLDEWMKASPASYAPLVARGLYELRLAAMRRGLQRASRTTDAQWKGMNESGALARKDLEESLERHPTLAARRGLMVLNTMTSTPDEGPTSQIELALRQCPASIQMHIKHIFGLVPRWGGSYEQMAEFAGKAPVRLNPKLKVLVGAVESDKCFMANDDNEALEHCERALDVGPYWEFLADRARILNRLERFQEALAALDKAIEQRPQVTWLHLLRARVLGSLKRPEEAQKASALARELDPLERLIL